MAYNGKLWTCFRLSQRLYSKLYSGRQVRNRTASNAGSRNVGSTAACNKKLWFTIVAAGTGLGLMTLKKKFILALEGPGVYNMSCEGKGGKEDEDNNSQGPDESQKKRQKLGKVSELLPVRFSETIVRVYSKLPKNSKKESLDEALKDLRKCEKEEIEKEKKMNIRIKELLKDAQLELRKKKASDGAPGKTKEKHDGDN